MAGALSLALAMGVGRFAFTPLLPMMLQSGLVDVVMGGWLAVANHAGYLLGAWLVSFSTQAPQRLGLWALWVMAVATWAMGCGGPMAAWLVWRFLAGLASAFVLVSTSTWCLERLAQLGWPEGAGVVYAGVGAGIALAGIFCWQVSLPPAALWLILGATCFVGLLVVATLMPHGRVRRAPETASPSASQSAMPRGLVLCYGVLGFAYVVPATFLPVLARSVVAPDWYGSAWPAFGLASFVSTGWAGWALRGVARRHVFAASHVIMALGCLLPVLHLSAATVLVSALLVGGTFMVASLAGLQEARTHCPQRPAYAIGRMTMAFAWGQLAGPALSACLLARDTKGETFTGLFIALGLAALLLVLSATWLAMENKR